MDEEEDLYGDEDFHDAPGRSTLAVDHHSSGDYADYDYEDEYEAESFHSPGRNPQTNDADVYRDLPPGEQQGSGSRSNNQKEEDEEEDEQWQQKQHSKLDYMTTRMELLEQEILNQRQYQQDLQRTHEEKVAALTSQLSEYDKLLSQQAQETKAIDDQLTVTSTTLEEYKQRCEMLQAKLDEAPANLAMNTSSLAENSSMTSHMFVSDLQSVSTEAKPMGTEVVPTRLMSAFLTCAHQHQSLFPDLITADNGEDKAFAQLSLDDCVYMIDTLAKRTPRRSKKAEKQQDSMDLTSGALTLSLSDKDNFLPVDDVAHLKQRIIQLTDRIRSEKDRRRHAEQDLLSAKKKIQMLSEHIDKLMIHLRREAAHKVRIADAARTHEKDSNRWKEKHDLLHRKCAVKDRLIFEMREGSKILEDQLRLMDEKYLELRGKLDWARMLAEKRVKRAEKELAELRMKIVMSGTSLAYLESRTHVSSSDLRAGSLLSEPTDNDQQLWDMTNSGLYDQPSTMKLHTGKGSRARPLSQLSATQRKPTSGFQLPKAEPTLDGVLEKIRVQQNAKQEWTEEKAKKLTQSR